MNYSIQDSLKRSIYCKLLELNKYYWKLSDKPSYMFINSEMIHNTKIKTIGINYVGDITIVTNYKDVKRFEDKGILSYYVPKKLFGLRGNSEELGRIIYEIVNLTSFCKDNKNKLAIYVPCTEDIRSWWSNFYLWGDYQMGIQLKKSFEKHNFNVSLVMMPYWNNKCYDDCDVKLILRGNSKYIPNKKHKCINLLWNLYDPETLTEEYCSLYDHIFVCSEYHQSKLKCKNMSILMQCVNNKELTPIKEIKNRLIFVGNNRRETRIGVKWAKENNMDLEIYGVGWKNSKVLNSKEVKEIYSGNIILNDHLTTMREYGYVSNKCFEIVANGGRLLCDNVKGIKDVFKDYVTIYEDDNDLLKKHEMMVLDKDIIKVNKEWIDKNSYDERVNTIIMYIKKLQ